MNRKTLLLLSFVLALPLWSFAGEREKQLINDGWRFALGDASSMEKDFSHGTEYFTYLAKASSADHNRGPAWIKFDDKEWQNVTLPHDWVVDLPYSADASHSHGYKQVGWRYPQNSIGWYRRHLVVDKNDEGRRIVLQFDGIFRNAQVFINGFYLGHETSGYATQTYDVSDYLNYGGDNIIAVRCDATTEEGWYYEGAGIYRNVWLIKTDATHYIKDVSYSYTYGQLKVSVDADGDFSNALYDAEGRLVASGKEMIHVPDPHHWNASQPYLYRLKTTLSSGGNVTDVVWTHVGLRVLEFSVSKGFLVNGHQEKLQGADLHLDHAGVGVGVPDELWVYKVKKLKELGMNAIRCSHNPATPAMLDVCDSLGMYVIDENRLMGTNDEHFSLLRRMIERDRNHPSVILWSIGNEEWAIESGPVGEKIAKRMTDFCHTIDPSRKVTYGNSGGFGIVKHTDVHGYNYIVQNDVKNRHEKYPDWFVIGTEETTGSGTRNIYVTDNGKGHMAPINYIGEERTNWEKNVIARGWKFYRDNMWAGGLFYWTGFDYRGEPNPMKWPATGSEFGILDYCGFPKDEAYYLKAQWIDEPVLHVFPHGNMPGMEGKEVSFWAYTNCDEVELFQNGKSLGRRVADNANYVEWKTAYHPEKIIAVGYVKGKAVMRQNLSATGKPSRIEIVSSKELKGKKGKTIMQPLRADGQDVVVLDLNLLDSSKRLVPDACEEIEIEVVGPAEILGWGNGDPAYKTSERPAKGESHQKAIVHSFMGNAQVILRSVVGDNGNIRFSATLRNGAKKTLVVRN